MKCFMCLKMHNTFEYMYETVSRDSIEIEDIGNCALECYNDSGDVYYLIVSTKIGYTEFIEFGPYSFMNDEQVFGTKFNFMYKHIEYDDYKIKKLIDTFITDKYKKLTQIKEVSQKYAFDKLQDIKLCIKNEMPDELSVDWSDSDDYN